MSQISEQTSELLPINMDKDGNPTDGKGEWKQFLCRACGWIYDEKLGDPDGGLPAGTRFDDIPDDWVCPLCGVTKRDFEPFFGRNLAIVKPNVNPISDTGGLVIIGGGLAGWSVVEAVRLLSPDYPITLITADSGDRYHKPQLSVAISKNQSAENLVQETALQASEKLNIGLVANTFVIHIDKKNKQVRTTRGDFYFEKLVFALGAKPALPKSLPPQFVWRINHKDMFAKLQEKLQDKPHQTVAIIGAGMIGTELAEDIATAGHKVYLIDINNLPLVEILPTKAGQIIKDALARGQIDFLGEHQVNQISQKNGQYLIEFSDKPSILVDEVVASTGLMVDERLPIRAGVDFLPRLGIIVDENTLQTSNSDMFAIGDCMNIGGQACRFVAPLREQANTIAHQILAIDHIGYQHRPPIIRLKTKSVAVTLSGLPNKTDEWQTKVDDGNTLIMQQNDIRLEVVVNSSYYL